jgi:FkbH-like protein
VVWDLDNTLWNGVLLEDGHVEVRQEAVETIRRLDAVGILHSIASRNDREAALQRLKEEGLDEYFLVPQINWNPKSSSVERIAGELSLGLDALAFIDDQEFERAEVSHALPQVMCLDAAEAAFLPEREEFSPRFVTDESAKRREMYRSATLRNAAEEEFTGTNEEFLASLDMVFTIAPAGRDDLQRAEELTIRTNQLNSTGRTYSYEELDKLRESPDHVLLVASLTDRLGDYGKIGLALVERGTGAWHLRLLLMSCRVLSRGVGAVLLNHVRSLAAADGAVLRADFVETGRNRMMYVTYAFSGFREIGRDGSAVLLEADPDRVPAAPDYLKVQVK